MVQLYMYVQVSDCLRITLCILTSYYQSNAILSYPLFHIPKQSQEGSTLLTFSQMAHHQFRHDQPLSQISFTIIYAPAPKQFLKPLHI